MIYRLIPPATLQAEVALPASKSLSNRALILQALAACNEPIGHLAVCDDTTALAHALQQQPETIDIEGAGTAMRFLTALLSITPGEHLLTGNRRMQERPIGVLVEALRALGGDIAYTGAEGFPPLKIRGTKLKGDVLTMAGNVSSQYISALMMIAPTLEGGVTLQLTGKVLSRPYIDMTMQMMREFGAEASWTDEQQLRVEQGAYRWHAFEVESDWSAASYWYALTALYPDALVRLLGLKVPSCQGDSQTATLFEQLGVTTRIAAGGVELQNTPHTRVPHFEADFSAIPDLAQTFAVACCLLELPFRISGLESLYIKETDRMQALQNELGKLGFCTHEPSRGVLEWHGERRAVTHPVVIETYGDHRMAMAFAPAAVRWPGTGIAHPEVVSKSYPEFWHHLQANGFALKG